MTSLEARLYDGFKTINLRVIKFVIYDQILKL